MAVAYFGSGHGERALQMAFWPKLDAYAPARTRPLATEPRRNLRKFRKPDDV
jgi:hypothetical protein